MKETILERVINAKKDYDIGQVVYFNNGEVDTETNHLAKRMEKIYDNVELEMLTQDFCNATAVYSRMYELDTMEVGLLLGLIYKAEDINEEKQPKLGAQPINNIVRYYDSGFNCYLNGEQTNKHDFGENNVTHQGYIHYDNLVKAFENSGIEFTGPKTFKEFKEAITSGEIFDVSLIANLEKKYSKKLSK